MKASIWSSYYVDLSPEDAMVEFAKHGFKYCELSDEHGLVLLDRGGDPKIVGKQFGEFARKNNVQITQGHLWLNCKICTIENAIDILKKWIDLYEAIGIKSAVLHCDVLSDRSDLTPQQRIDLNISKLRELDEYLHGKDITICLENLRERPVEGSSDLSGINIDDLLFIIKELGSPNFGICFDTGHLNLNKIVSRNQRDFILKGGKLIKALHLDCNDGTADQHLMPFSRSNIDFIEVFTTLKEIGYEGLYNFEIPGDGKGPLPIRGFRLDYIKKMCDYLDETI